jgi:hypothetical protein
MSFIDGTNLKEKETVPGVFSHGLMATLGSCMTIDVLEPVASNPVATDAPRLYDQQGNYHGKLSTNPAGLSGLFGFFGLSGLFGSSGFSGSSGWFRSGQQDGPNRPVTPTAATALRSRRTRSRIPSAPAIPLAPAVPRIPTAAACGSKESDSVLRE